MQKPQQESSNPKPKILDGRFSSIFNTPTSTDQRIDPGYGYSSILSTKQRNQKETRDYERRILVNLRTQVEMANADAAAAVPATAAATKLKVQAVTRRTVPNDHSCLYTSFGW